MGTHTYVEMPVSSQTFQEIKRKLEEAGYQHAIDCSGETATLDMHGIALIEDDE